MLPSGDSGFVVERGGGRKVRSAPRAKKIYAKREMRTARTKKVVDGRRAGERRAVIGSGQRIAEKSEFGIILLVSRRNQ